METSTVALSPGLGTGIQGLEPEFESSILHFIDSTINRSSNNASRKQKKIVAEKNGTMVRIFFRLIRTKMMMQEEKSKIIPLRKGIALLGFRVYYRYKLLKKSNARRIWKRLDRFGRYYAKGELSRKEVVQSLEGWLAYAGFANSYNLRRKVVARFNELFGSQK